MSKIKLWILLAITSFFLMDGSIDIVNAREMNETIFEENSTEQDDSTKNENFEQNQVDQEKEVEKENGEAEQEEVQIEDIVLEQQEITLKVGENYQINFTTQESGGIITYTSLDPKIATVTPQGIITGVSGGTSGESRTIIKVLWMSLDKTYTISQDYVVDVENTITIDKEELELYAGSTKNTYQLKATANPAGTIRWSSSNEYVAKIDKQGVIKTKNPGSTYITAEVNGVQDTCYVTVKQSYLEIESTEIIYVNHTVPLDYNMEPEGKITWKSSNPKVATVDKKGRVKGKKTGTTIITAIGNGIKKKCKVTVQKPSISIYHTSLTLFSGSSYKMSAYATPSSASIKWKSTNPKIVKVSKNGMITTKNSGTAKIMASIAGARAECEITVVDNSFQLNTTKRTITKGDKFQLFVKDTENISSIQYSLLDCTGAVKITMENNICTVQGITKGVERIQVSFVVYQDGISVKYSGICTVKVTDQGISKQQFSMAKGTSQKLKIIYSGKEKIASISWKSSSPKIVSINKSGIAKGVKGGSAKISAQVTFKNGSKKNYTSKVRVSTPHLSENKLVLAKGTAIALPVQGVNDYSQIKIKSKNKSIVTVRSDGTLRTQTPGRSNIDITTDGKKLSCEIVVTDPQLQSDYSRCAIGSECQIPLTGLDANSKVTYESSNGSVAVVDGSGKVSVNGGGRAVIFINADGKELYYLVESASQRAISACETGYSIISVSTYSQAKRMSEGYYDCSALVFRGYGKDAGLLGGTPSWAPTAAGMAQHMRDTGKVIAWEPISVEELRPGDLIFYGQENNGRYLGIYHVSMYYGNYRRLESPLDYYYERSNIVMVARPAP